MPNRYADGRIGETEGEFSVTHYLAYGPELGVFNENKCVYEYVRKWVSAQEAMEAFMHYISSVGARMGTSVCVLITDGGDMCNMQWTWTDGIIFPEDLKGQYKHGEPAGQASKSN